jgi:tetratricopeptide (TPR) repeat protein
MQRMFSKGSYAAARDAAQECRDLALSHFGAAHPVSASAVNNLALMHKSLGHDERATELYREALSLYRMSVGEVHRSTATVACNLALLLRDTAARSAAGREIDTASETVPVQSTADTAAALAEARTLLEGAVAARSQVLEPGHPEVALAKSQLASILRVQGDLDGASELLERAVEHLDASHFAAEATQGTDALKTSRLGTLLAGALNSLALLRKQQVRLAEAEPLYLRASALYDRSVGESSSDAIVCRHNMAELALARGDEAAALRLQQDILRRVEAAEKAAGPGKDVSHPIMSSQTQ